MLSELAAITPGPYLHIGGDEASSTPATDYTTFVNRVQPIVGAARQDRHRLAPDRRGQTARRTVSRSTGERPRSDADLSAGGEQGRQGPAVAGEQGVPRHEVHQLDAARPDWAGLIEVQTAYNWDPGAYLSGVPASAILGVEAPLWTETITELADIEYMAFPRLPAIAELGWSPQSHADWDTFKVRLGAQGPRWTVQGINYYRSPQVPWPAGA